MKKIIIIMAAVAMLTGCRTTKYVTVPEHHTDTVYQVKQQRDSVWLHDSVFVHEYTKGDTIFRDRDRWHTHYVERLTVDTFYQSRVDSVPVPYEVVKEVEKKLTWWQQARIHMGELLLALIAAAAGIGLWRLKKKFMP
jgi:hypothetical protein